MDPKVITPVHLAGLAKYNRACEAGCGGRRVASGYIHSQQIFALHRTGAAAATR